MKELFEKHWIRIDNLGYPKDGGVWVVYLNSVRKTEWILNQIRPFLTDNNLIGSSIRVNPSNIFTIETTIDRFDIHRVKKIIIDSFSKYIKDLHWKAGFESLEDWTKQKFPKGELWYLGRLENMVEDAFNYINQGRIEKAKRIHNEFLKTSGEFRHSLLIDKIQKRKKMIVQPVFNKITYDIKPDEIFLIMPFNEIWSKTTYEILKDVAAENNLIVKRADEIFTPGSVIEDIWTLICECGLIIADISVHNPNVFYELGIAHSIGKKVLMIKQENSEKSPFDIGFWRFYEYSTEYDKAKEFKVAMSKILSNYKKSVI